ncbi:hypothetical protein ACGFNX_15650 [Streptomyces sp. NPDC048723]|uniref:hypothetical protein n=1 Tax=Streptomyces sp. NPDC048723 TaxID=3365589 RepID=UPI003724127F
MNGSGLTVRSPAKGRLRTRTRTRTRLKPISPATLATLEVQSQVFDAGPLSVLTVHRIRPVTELDPEVSEPFGAQEAFASPRADCIYVENLNVWLSRGAAGGNVGLVYSPPVGFGQGALPRVPSWYSPRAVCSAARCAQVLPDPATDHWEPAGPEVTVDHAVDLVDDVNGLHRTIADADADGA